MLGVGNAVGSGLITSVAIGATSGGAFFLGAIAFGPGSGIPPPVIARGIASGSRSLGAGGGVGFSAQSEVVLLRIASETIPLLRALIAFVSRRETSMTDAKKPDF